MKILNYYFIISILIFSFVSCSQNEDSATLNSRTSEEGISEITHTGSDAIEGDFVHMVFFWLKEPDNKAVKERFTNSLIDLIKNSDDIKFYHLGTPANTYRPIIDTSYTYCLIVTFPSKEEHDRYQNDPVHKEFLKKFKDSWEKVLIYDSESIK